MLKGEVGDHTVLIPLGIERLGFGHILGFRQGVIENTVVVRWS